MEKSIMINWVSIYLKAGWSLIPICTRDKKPLIPWQEFQMRCADTKEVKEWIRKWPDMNLGAVTGKISGIVIVDLDGVEGKIFGITQHLASSVVSKTGNGKQVFYKWTEHVDNSVKKIAPGVDIRGDGGFVVVPPSIHPNGKRYRWERFVDVAIKELPEMPKHIFASHVSKECTNQELSHKQEGWIAKALEEMKIGNIDDTLTSVAGRLRRDGYSSDDAYSLLQPHAVRAGATAGHLEEKIKNIWSRYEPRDRERNQSISQYETRSELSIHSPADDDSFNKFQCSMGTERICGIKTGFPTLDKYFEGGLKSERLFTVAARTGTGKTNFAIALAANLCQQGKKVLFFSTEFQYEKIWQRYIATLSIPDAFRKHAFHVCDSFSPRIEQVEEAIKRIMPDVFIFDHINHISEERESLGAFMQGANFLQRKYNSQGVMVAQLSRQADWVENGKRIEPRMSMIKGSGTIEQASSRVLLLSETRVTPEVNEVLGVLDKNDSGDRGIINFGLYKSPYHFREIV